MHANGSLLKNVFLFKKRQKKKGKNDSFSFLANLIILVVLDYIHFSLEIYFNLINQFHFSLHIHTIPIGADQVIMHVWHFLAHSSEMFALKTTVMSIHYIKKGHVIISCQAVILFSWNKTQQFSMKPNQSTAWNYFTLKHAKTRAIPTLQANFINTYFMYDWYHHLCRKDILSVPSSPLILSHVIHRFTVSTFDLHQELEKILCHILYNFYWIKAIFW